MIQLFSSVCILCQRVRKLSTDEGVEVGVREGGEKQA